MLDTNVPVAKSVHSTGEEPEENEAHGEDVTRLYDRVKWGAELSLNFASPCECAPDFQHHVLTGTLRRQSIVNGSIYFPALPAIICFTRKGVRRGVEGATFA